MIRWAVALALLLFPQQEDSPLGGQHTSRDPRKCKVCAPALRKAMAYLQAKGAAAGYTQKLMMGWMGLADKSGACNGYVARAIDAAAQARSVGFNGNWAPAMASIFLAAAHYRTADGKAAAGLANIMAECANNQHHTGGWHHNKNFKMQGYADDLGVLTCMIYGMMVYMKSRGMGVPQGVFDRAEKNLETLKIPTGIGYGTGSNATDRVGSHGAYAYIGIAMAEAKDNKFYDHLTGTIHGRFNRLAEGHCVSCLHWLSVSVACYLQGQDTYDSLCKEWLDKCMAKQQPDGSVLLGDDKAGGGEEKYLGDRVGSTAVFALMLMLQEPGCFDPARGNKPRK